MPDSLLDPQVRATLDAARVRTSKEVVVDGQTKRIEKPFRSPTDWREHWIYFLMLDRFNNPAAPPRNTPFDAPFGGVQGGTLAGVREKLAYLQNLGAGALWLTPVFRNTQFNEGSYHGYGIQNFIEVDPRFGTEQDFESLVEEAHARGIYIILDVVINHAGDIFGYQPGCRSEAPGQDFPYSINWRNGDGTCNPRWSEAPAPDDPQLTPNAAVFPQELRQNRFFRRQGLSRSDEQTGDFASLKEMVTELGEENGESGFHFPVRNALIATHQYVIARFDVDGFRIDTLKHVERDFARTFGNAMREFAYSIGKLNFLTFGETADNDEKIARYTGRFASDPDDLIGVDSALDFPLFNTLPHVAKGFRPPSDLAQLYEFRKRLHRGQAGDRQVLISSHAEASRFFVTFLDNHDQRRRFRHEDASEPGRFDNQVSMSIGCLLSLQGIPVLYYGTEQGLHGEGDSDLFVREALWGKPNAFNIDHALYRDIREIARVRADNPALRYGRQYFRQVSGDGSSFAVWASSPGIISFSRILNDREVLIAVNTFVEAPATFEGFVVVDFGLNPVSAEFEILFSNRGSGAQPPAAVVQLTADIFDLSGSRTQGDVRAIRVTLQPMEIQILGQKQTG